MEEMQGIKLEKTTEIVRVALNRYHNPLVLEEEIIFWQSHLINPPEDFRVVINSEINHLIQTITKNASLEAEILQARFIQKKSILKTALEFNLSRDQLNRRQKAGIQHLAKLLANQQEKIRKKRMSLLLSNLESPQTLKLFGLEKTENALQKYLLSPETHHIITITGIGGIGKTALANHTIRSIIPKMIFWNIIWTKANNIDELVQKLITHFQIEFSEEENRSDRVIQVLNEMPTLIIIDGVDSSSQMIELLQDLLPYANPTKFIITSRIQPDYHVADIVNVKLEELSKSSSLELIEDYIKTAAFERHLPALQDVLDDIYDVIGGNPLALRLFIGLLEIFPLRILLADFKKADIKNIEELYATIFIKSWESLSKYSQSLLRAMLVTNIETGAKLEHLAENTELGDKALFGAIHQLVIRSLLEKRGTTSRVRYGIHRLTNSFLETKFVINPDYKSLL